MTQNHIIDTNLNRTKVRIINLFLFLAVGIEVFFLIYDIPYFQKFFPTRKSEPQSDPIAQIMAKTNSVRMQEARELTWENIEVQQYLHNEDLLMTSDTSQAEVAFLDGTDLMIGENSLVQIQRNLNSDGLGNQKMVVKLLRGSLKKIRRKSTSENTKIQISKTPEFEIQAGSVTAKVKSDTELTVSIPSSTVQSAQISIQKGEAQVETEQKTMSLQQGQALELNPRKAESSLKELIVQTPPPPPKLFKPVIRLLPTRK